MEPAESPPTYRSVVRMRVHYAEVDRMDLLHHSNHLRYFERGREEYLRRRGVGYRALEDSGVLVVVADVSVQYKAPVRYQEEVDLEVVLQQVRHATVSFAYHLRRVHDGALAATGTSRHAFLSREGRLLRAPASLLAQLQCEERVKRLGELEGEG